MLLTDNGPQLNVPESRRKVGEKKDENQQISLLPEQQFYTEMMVNQQ